MKDHKTGIFTWTQYWVLPWESSSFDIGFQSLLSPCTWGFWNVPREGICAAGHPQAKDWRYSSEQRWMKKPPHRFGSRWRLQQLKRCHLVLHRRVLRGQETLHVFHLEELQCSCAFCRCALSDHAVCLKQSHIVHIQTDFHKSSWQEEEWREQRAPPSACWVEVLSPPTSVGGRPGIFPTSLHPYSSSQGVQARYVRGEVQAHQGSQLPHQDWQVPGQDLVAWSDSWPRGLGRPKLWLFQHESMWCPLSTHPRKMYFWPPISCVQIWNIYEFVKVAKQRFQDG